ncbi:hypothetical protein TNCV_484661 [Trichonephila clavipes]|nr:hypothetical protein TNCV_484661 [Trichonephila clavipes]
MGAGKSTLFTDESRFSLSSDSHRILIWREWEAAIIQRTSLKGQVWRFRCSRLRGVMFGSRTDLHISGRRFSQPVIVNDYLFFICASFRGAMGLQFSMDDNAPCHRTVAVEQP